MSFAAGSQLIQSDSNISSGTDVVNKNYVDAVAQGLHIKESVHVISLEPITTYGTQLIDSHLVQVGERVLVNGQDNSNPTASNGIYVVDSMTWSRSEDADGLPSLGEVQIGDFVFVGLGASYSGSGWVLNQSDSLDFDILVGTESQKWVQFSSAGVISAGDGLVQTGTDLNVNTGNGLSIDSISNSIVLGGTLSQNTTINGSQSYSFIIDEINDFKLNFTGSATVSVGSGQKGLVYSATPSNADPLTLIHKDYVDNQIGGLADVDNLSIILNDDNKIQISPTAAGQGLTFSEITGIIDVIWGGTGSGLTFSGGATLSVSVDENTIQINNNGELTVVAGASTPVYQLVTGTTSTGDDHPTGITLSFTPNDYSRIEVYVNGQKQRLGDGVTNVDCYFDFSGKSLVDLIGGDELYWNGIISGYDLSLTDSIEIVYEK